MIRRAGGLATGQAGKPRASGDDPEFTDALVNRIG